MPTPLEIRQDSVTSHEQCRLGARAEGGTSALALDGVPWLAVSDPTFTTGGAGILVVDSASAQRIDAFSATAR